MPQNCMLKMIKVVRFMLYLFHHKNTVAKENSPNVRDFSLHERRDDLIHGSALVYA